LGNLQSLNVSRWIEQVSLDLDKTEKFDGKKVLTGLATRIPSNLLNSLLLALHAGDTIITTSHSGNCLHARVQARRLCSLPILLPVT